MSNQPPPPPPPPPRYPYQSQHPPQHYTGGHRYSVPNQLYGNHDHTASLCPPPPAYAYNAYPYPINGNVPYTWSNHGVPPPPPPPPARASVSRRDNRRDLTQHHQNQSRKKRRINDGHTNQTGETGQWRCDICAVSLDSESALTAHRAAHIKCTHCDYTASRKLVKAHYQSVHGKFSGRGFKTVTVAIPGCPIQRFRICVGNHPDDIKQWIQDRKKRFPRLSTASTEAPKDGGGRRAQVQEEDGKTKALSSLLDGYGSSSSEEGGSQYPVEQNGAQNAPTTMCRTGLETSKTGDGTNCSSNASGQDDNKERCNTVVGASHVSNYRTRPCRYFMRNGTCRNGDACTFSHEIAQKNLTTSAQADSHNRQPRSARKDQSKKTLLRKLLENDARRETTLTLQLLRHIVDSNYLQPR